MDRIAGLDLGLRHREHALHRLLPADAVRDRRAEAGVPAEDGHRRDPGGLLALGARGGSDVQGIKSVAKKGDDGDWELNGQKMWVTNGLRSGVVFVLMKTDPKADPPHRGMTCFITEKEPGAAENPGAHRAPADQEDGLQGRGVHRARLQRLPVPARPHPRRRGGRSRQGLHAR